VAAREAHNHDSIVSRRDTDSLARRNGEERRSSPTHAENRRCKNDNNREPMQPIVNNLDSTPLEHWDQSVRDATNHASLKLPAY
jgi:hypothetical protein